MGLGEWYYRDDATESFEHISLMFAVEELLDLGGRKDFRRSFSYGRERAGFEGEFFG
jgi:hypothetical protein